MLAVCLILVLIYGSLFPCGFSLLGFLSYFFMYFFSLDFHTWELFEAWYKEEFFEAWYKDEYYSEDFFALLLPIVANTGPL